MAEYTYQVDVRGLAPKDRHPKIFGTIDQLHSGQTFQITNDHDPKPLQSKLMEERKGEFDWAYLEEGPDVWKVVITKK